MGFSNCFLKNGFTNSRDKGVLQKVFHGVAISFPLLGAGACAITRIHTVVGCWHQDVGARLSLGGRVRGMMFFLSRHSNEILTGRVMRSSLFHTRTLSAEGLQ